MRHGVGAAGAAFVILAAVASTAIAGPRDIAPAMTVEGTTWRHLARLQAEPPGYVPPGANVGEAPPPERHTSVTEKWWFWAAVSGVVVTTVVVVLIAGRAPSPPASTLGNMEAFGGH